MLGIDSLGEGRRNAISSLILGVYTRVRHERVRAPLRRLALRTEGGVFYSLTIRDIFRKFYGVDVGLYTYGPLETQPGLFNQGTTIGRYSSIYWTVRRFNTNHPVNTKSTHPFFYEPALGKVQSDIIKRTPLNVGSDVWIGHNATILNSVQSIGDGAVIGAGSVVYNDVPPYAIVTGFPARVVRYRFSPKKIEELLAEKWWLKSIDELCLHIDEFREPFEESGPIR